MPDLKIRQQLWNDLEAAAAKQGQQPELLAAKALEDYLRHLAEEEFIAESQRAARRSKLRIADTEEVVRRHRARKH